jgi:surfeit locus 1 family protein
MAAIIAAAAGAGAPGRAVAESMRIAAPGRWLLVLLAALTCGGLLALGFWQLDRGREKAVRLERFARALEARQPTPLAAALAQSDGMPQRVAGRVRIVAGVPWLLLDNQRRGAAVGLRAYRVAEVGDEPQRLLVEFGWLPMPPSRVLPTLPVVPDEVEVDGLLLSPPAAGIRLAANPPLVAGSAAALLLTHLDPVELAGQLGRPLHPQVLRPDPAQPIGFDRDSEALPNTLSPAQHYGYAVQWFGLSAALAVIVGLLLFRRRP